MVAVLLFTMFIAIKYLIDHSFKQQEKLKTLEGVILANMLKKFEEDIDGLGSKLRGFKSAMESFQNTVAKVDINHTNISLRLSQIESYIQTLDKLIESKVHYAFLKVKDETSDRSN